jgi:hypothetical protein
MPRQGRQATSRKRHPAPVHRHSLETAGSSSAKQLVFPGVCLPESRLASLANLASVEIETTLVNDLSGSLRHVFDDVCEKALPIYFGPLLGRLYLEGL